jgi:hypothetical protein
LENQLTIAKFLGGSETHRGAAATSRTIAQFPGTQKIAEHRCALLSAVLT